MRVASDGTFRPPLVTRLASFMESTTTSVVVIVHHITSGDETSASLARNHQPITLRLSRAPVAGELIHDRSTNSMDQVLQVAHDEDGTAHAFVFSASVPPHVAQAFGITGTGVRSSNSFGGKTIGEMISFLARYPADMPVTFNDRHTLVASVKTDFLVLRLDDSDE